MNTQPTEADRVGAEIMELCAYIYAATYRLLVLIGEFDRNGYWKGEGLSSCAHWLNFKCGIGMNAAREKVRVAKALAGLPKISAAFERGEPSYSKVRAMTRIAVESNEDYLLNIANSGTACHMERLVSLYRRCKRSEETDAANEQYRSRELTWYHDEDDSLVIKCRLPAEQGALVLKALEAAIEHGGGAAPVPDGGPAPIDPPDHKAVMNTEDPWSARRADALAGIAETYLNSGPAAKSTADRYQVVVHVSAETLRKDVSAETSGHINDGLSHLDSGRHVSAETSRRIGCDCSIVRLIEDGDGEPLSIGRRSRSIPPAIRRALRARDDGCRFPGCTHRHYLDGHHIEQWSHGGETSLNNLVQLCRHHHRLVHEGGFTCEHGPDGNIVFRDLFGTVVDDAYRLPPIPYPQDPVRWFRERQPELVVDAKTCTPTDFESTDIDWPLAVELLFDRSTADPPRSANQPGQGQSLASSEVRV